MSTINQSGDRISEYLLEARVGAGTFGEVWRARHHVWESEHVAVKLPTEPQYVRYLQREGVVVHGLRHPNIVRVMGLDPYAERPYLVMELVDGPSLRQVLDDHPRGLPIDVTRVALTGVLSALRVAHAANVVHRDLKPGNVLLNLRDRPLEGLEVEDVKVGDFGLGIGEADTLRSIAQSASLARDDALVGTLAYMAPEVRDGGRKADAQSDLYAVGVMLFEMLTGERPAGAELPSTVRPDAGDFDGVFRRLYSRQDRRYASADEVLADLPRPTPPSPPPLPITSRQPPPLPNQRDTQSEWAFGTRGFVTMCRDCGGSVDSSDQFCIHCGKQLIDSVRRCPACSGYPAPDDRYCIFCGAALSHVAEA